MFQFLEAKPTEHEHISPILMKMRGKTHQTLKQRNKKKKKTGSDGGKDGKQPLGWVWYHSKLERLLHYFPPHSSAKQFKKKKLISKKKTIRQVGIWSFFPTKYRSLLQLILIRAIIIAKYDNM